ncbi:MAG: hypothetical protein II304_00455 [Bacteroidales bacterium]|nr:hypothetical protein [Bacteroidales bacterium]
MGKFLVRMTIVTVTIYQIIAYLIAELTGVDILTGNHILLFELCVVVYTFSEGKYHCKYMKYTALSILLADTLTRLDYMFDFMSVTAHNLIPIAILAVGIGTSVTKAFIHFYRVLKLKYYGDKHLQ